LTLRNVASAICTGGAINDAIITGIASGERRRIRLDYADTTGNASLKLPWSVNGGAFVDLPDSALTPS
jgi:hypothetical protein